jgi:hypothetical protein
MIENGDLEIYEENDLQRLAGIWDEKRKSLLIESLMISLPLPMFYLDGSDRPWRIIDGLQRLTTLFQYISPKSNDPFELKHLEYLKEEFNKYPFIDLPLNMKRRILEAPIEAYVINPGTPPAVKYNIFQRINTRGLPLTGQEVRNAVYRGIPSDFTKGLALFPEFKKATNNKVSVKRMVDREYVSRFIAFQLYKDQYIADIDEFLRLAMQSLYDANSYELQDLEERFKLSMTRNYELLGPYAFFRIDKNGKPGRGPNKALYDTLSWNMIAIEEIQFEKLMKNKDNFRKQFIKLQNDNLDFFKAINDTTSSKTNVKNRFEILQSFIQEQL